ncbi:MAG: hypothetical protein ACEPOW_11660 [Bacteroidales bacterium]
MKKDYQIKKIVSSILLPIMLLLSWNTVSNWHYHILSSGEIVKHAHPFKKSSNNSNPIKSHTHSQCEFCNLNHLSHSFLDNKQDFESLKNKELTTFIYVESSYTIYLDDLDFHFSGLSPPLA